MRVDFLPVVKNTEEGLEIEKDNVDVIKIIYRNKEEGV